MAEYIERDAAREKCCSLCRWEGTENCDECEHPIDDIPTADVVPVVRCKDCDSYSKRDGWCRSFEIYQDENGFCSYGERKDGDA